MNQKSPIAQLTYLITKSLVLLLLFLSGPISFAQEQSSQSVSSKPNSYVTIEWTDLIPKEDLDILLNPPSYITDIQDGAAEDAISNQLKTISAEASEDRYQQALVSKTIKPEMDGQAVRLPGFIVPLEFDGQQVITQFFLVPYFGACLHMPPPPPNQIIFVRYPKGFELEALYYPVWLTGILETSLTENDMATAAYSMDMHSHEMYSEENAY